MASPGRSLVVLLGLLTVGAALAGAARWTLAEGAASPALAQLAALLTPLVGAALLTLALLAAFRALSFALRRRGLPDATLRPLEGASAAVVVVALGMVVAGGSGSAFTGLGLVGAGIALALQRPILAVAGWAAIRFGRLFREGDRIEVQAIVGDVLDVGLFSTRLWEIGSAESPLPWGGAVSPLRQTGRIVTLSNATFLEHPVANATSDVPLVFDEFVVTVAYEADWRLARELLARVGAQVLDPEAHARAAERYERLTEGLPIQHEFPRAPDVHVALRDSWIELRLRHLVDVRARGRTRSALAVAWQEAVEQHAARLPNVYPRVQPMAVDAAGRAAPPATPQPPA